MPTALIAEDEPLLAAALQADLAALWPELEMLAQAATADSALELALAQRPDDLLSRHPHARRSGLEAAQALAEDWPTANRRRSRCWCSSPPTTSTRCRPSRRRRWTTWSSRCSATPGGLRARLQARLAARAPTRGRGTAGHAGSAARAARRGRTGRAAAGGHPGPGRRLVHLVPVDEVVYFEAADKYVRVVTAEREHLIRLSLRELLPQLDPQRFWQVHRGTVVQARCITSARREESGKVTLSLRVAGRRSWSPAGCTRTCSRACRESLSDVDSSQARGCR
jgi:DNA-binding LytR/AlgR family response regulator